MPEQLARDLQTKAQSALAESAVAALRDLQVEHVGDTLALRAGLVSSFYHKQLAQEVVRLVIGDVALVNDIDVR